MNYSVKPGMRTGSVVIPSSKSYAHRQLISAALSTNESLLICNGISKDIAATISCLNSIGAQIEITDDTNIHIRPIDRTGIDTKTKRQLHCGESGTTLRFMLPVVGALNIPVTFVCEGKLAERPIDALSNELEAHGMKVTKAGNEITAVGSLIPGCYSIPGNISSQYISGLLFALPLLSSESSLTIEGNIESAGYITMTEETLLSYGFTYTKAGTTYIIPGSQQFTAPARSLVEADWSNGAFFMCMGALSKTGINIHGLAAGSRQGDRQILSILQQFGAEVLQSNDFISIKYHELKGITVDAAAIPDLVPTISALASLAEGTTRIVNAARLRFKESDRLATTTAMLKAIGADVEELADGLVINGRPSLTGGEIDAANDHRIAMAAAVAANGAKQEVTVIGSECINKSYPDFWKHLEDLEVIK